MGAFGNILGVVGALLILTLAGIGLVAIYPGRLGIAERSEARIRSWGAETHIDDLGRHAETAIFAEALRRHHGHGRHAAPDGDRSTER